MVCVPRKEGNPIQIHFKTGKIYGENLMTKSWLSWFNTRLEDKNSSGIKNL